jgi:hypothetical protein
MFRLELSMKKNFKSFTKNAERKNNGSVNGYYRKHHIKQNLYIVFLIFDGQMTKIISTVIVSYG